MKIKVTESLEHSLRKVNYRTHIDPLPIYAHFAQG